MLDVNLVSADRIVWSGEATTVNARTVEGELGVLTDHTPVLSLLTPSVVEIIPVSGEKIVASVDGGFISVANNRVSVLAEHAELGTRLAETPSGA